MALGWSSLVNPGKRAGYHYSIKFPSYRYKKNSYTNRFNFKNVGYRNKNDLTKIEMRFIKRTQKKIEF